MTPPGRLPPNPLEESRSCRRAAGCFGRNSDALVGVHVISTVANGASAQRAATRGVGRKRSCAALQIGPDPEERFVAKGLSRVPQLVGIREPVLGWMPSGCGVSGSALAEKRGHTLSDVVLVMTGGMC